MRTRRSFLNFITALTGQIISILAGIVARVIFTRYMSREYLGLSGLFTNILTMLSLVELGVGPAITFALYKPLAENDTETVKSLLVQVGAMEKPTKLSAPKTKGKKKKK